MATRYHQWRESTGEETAAVCRWLASQVRRLMKRVELLEDPEHAVKVKRHSLHAEILAELDRQRVKGERLAAAAARCVATGKAAVEDAVRLAAEVTSADEGHDVEHVTNDTMPTMMEPAKEFHKSRHVGGQPTAECQSVRPSRKRRVTHGGDEEAEVTSVEEGHNVERVTAERNDVACETMSATTSSRKRWTSLTPTSRLRNAC